MRPLASAPATARLAALAIGSLVVGLAAATATPSPARAQTQPQAKPKAPARGGAPASLARFIPSEGLIFYAEFEGLDAHAGPWRGSAAYRLLNETTLGAVLEDLAAQAFDRAAAGQGGVGAAGAGGGGGAPRPRLDGREAVAALERVARSGFVVAAHGKPPEKGRITIVVRGGARPEVRRLLDRLVEGMAGPKPGRETVRKGTRSITTVGAGDNAGAIWDDQGDTVLCDAPRVPAVLATLDGRTPSAANHPIRAELAKPEADFRPAGYAFLDVPAMGPVPADVARAGLDGLKRVDYRFGFQDDALMGIVRLLAPSPRRGMLALLDQPTFDLSSLPSLPAGLTGFTAASIDVPKTYERLVANAKAGEPNGAKQFADAEQAIQGGLGLDLRRDLLGHLGPKLALYSRSAPGGLPLLGAVLTLQIDDPAAVAKALPPVMQAVNRRLSGPNPNARQRPNAPTPEFLPLEGPRTAYILAFPPGVQPPGIFAVVQPTIVVGKDRLVIAARREAAEAALGEVGRWAPMGAFAPMARRLPSGLILLNVSDPRETLPAAIANLPAMLQQLDAAMAQAQARARQQAGGPNPPPAVAAPAPALRVDPARLPPPDAVARRLFPGSSAVTVDAQGVRVVTREAVPSLSSPSSSAMMVTLLLPAVQAAREAARRAQCVNNLKQIGVALHNYHAAERAFPKAAITDAQGRPLLSWRVAILPYLDQQALYAKFKLDEPWDGPHNRLLLQSMPASYACPSAKHSEPGITTYRAFVGPGTLLEASRGTKEAEVTDGTASTLAVVEASEGVPWTKPDELPFTAGPPAPLFGAGSPHPGGFNALFANGTVKFLKATIPIQVLRALITRSGGEKIPENAF